MKLVGLTFVFVIACGEEGGTGVDAPADATAHQFCVFETNRYRTMGGRTAVQYSAQLEAYANAGAMEDFNGQAHDHFRRTSAAASPSPRTSVRGGACKGRAVAT